MDDVTDTVFRRVVSRCSAPDLFFTEFANVDGLQSIGRERLLPKLYKKDETVPVIAQLWGKNPLNYYKTAKEVLEMGFAGVDINFGCPDKTIVKNECCSAMIKPNNRQMAIDIIHAVQDAIGGKIPVSVKTRLGFNEIDYTWHESLLNTNLDMLTIHARTRKEMSKVDAHWDSIKEIVSLRNEISPKTKLVGNGDIKNRQQAQIAAEKYHVDGVMIGRGIFHDPFCFADISPWENMSKVDRLELFIYHVELFDKTWQIGERRFETLKKFAKVYANGFEGASELRDRIMHSIDANQLLSLLRNEIS